MLYLKYNTASQIQPLGPLVGTDGTTPYTTALANTEIKLWKPGGTSLVNKNSGGSTHMASGVHYATFDATDANTLGMCMLYVIVTGQLIHKESVHVMETNVYDSWVAGTAYLETNPGKFSIAGATASLKNRAGSEQSTRTITDNASANPIVGLS
jgi:hypothetical protein